jgi:hypothetical protein
MIWRPCRWFCSVGACPQKRARRLGAYRTLQAAGEAADTYLVINATCVELFNVRDYVDKMAPEGARRMCATPGRSLYVGNSRMWRLMRGDGREGGGERRHKTSATGRVRWCWLIGVQASPAVAGMAGHGLLIEFEHPASFRTSYTRHHACRTARKASPRTDTGASYCSACPIAVVQCITKALARRWCCGTLSWTACGGTWASPPSPPR